MCCVFIDVSVKVGEVSLLLPLVCLLFVPVLLTQRPGRGIVCACYGLGMVSVCLVMVVRFWHGSGMVGL